jgi:hypothetical protein
LRLLELLRNSFIATAKTSYTAGTLGAIIFQENAPRPCGAKENNGKIFKTS